MGSEKIAFDFDSMEWQNITIDQVKFFENCYPDVDVVAILTKRMPAWLMSNPQKARKKNWLRFINNWLSREQERKA
uniref:Uncharacterized protein n=1 Tax=viral metagenome TaxID=1070528 RepID=A0A6H1ZX63_9ZZZZ